MTLVFTLGWYSSRVLNFGSVSGVQGLGFGPRALLAQALGKGPELVNGQPLRLLQGSFRALFVFLIVY